MGWFKKKEPPKVEKEVDYTKWEADFGFLTLILSRKKGITKEFLIGIYDKQKSDKDYLKDEEIEPIISNVVGETIEQLGSKYKSFLIDKYFGSEENLIKFVSEDVYVDLVSDAIKRNVKKITTTVQKNTMRALGNLNNKGSD